MSPRESRITHRMRSLLATRCARVLCALLVLSDGASRLSAQSQEQPRESPQARELHRALGLARKGDLQGALEIDRQLLEQNPNFAPAIKLKGMLFEEQGDRAEAAAAYEKALQLAPNDSDLLLKVGIYKLAGGEKEKAIHLLQRCLRVAPRDGDAEYYLAQAYHLNGQDDLALHAIEQALRAEPGSAAILQKYGELLNSTGNYQAGLQRLMEARKVDSSLPRIDYEIGMADYSLMDLQGAVESLSRETAAHPGDIQALTLLASAHLRLTRWAEAKSDYAQVLAQDPNEIESLLGLGHCEVELKEDQAAIATLSRVLQLDPTRLLAHFYLSRVYAAMGRDADSKHEAELHHLMMEKATFVRSAQTEQSENTIAPQVRQLLMDARESEALQLYRSHFKSVSATEADAYVFAGKTYLMMGKTEDGIRCLHHALQIEPTVRGARTWLGILYMSRGDLAGAETEFRSELANDPSFQQATAEIGEVRYHQQRWLEAAEYLDKSKTMTPELLFMLCDADFHLGKNSEATINAELVAAYGRDNARLMQDLADLLKRNGQQVLGERLLDEAHP